MIEKHYWQHLQEQSARGQLALFLGADLPSALTGVPSRAGLARELTRRHELDESLTLAEVAQRIGGTRDRFEVTYFLQDRLAAARPGPFHERIVELATACHVETITTAAYDVLLEWAFKDKGVALNRVVLDSNLRLAQPGRPTLIWLYGEVQQVDSLVITEQDHWNLLRDRNKEEMLAEVKRTFSQNTVLFLGYDLADPDFRFLFSQIACSRFARRAYAAWPGLPESEVKMWREQGIEILDAEPLAVIDGLLGAAMPPERDAHQTEVVRTSPSHPEQKPGSATPPPRVAHPQENVAVPQPAREPAVARSEPAGPTAALTWLHLSDLHFRKSQAYDENIVLKALLRDLVEQAVRPDFIAVSGDIAFSGQPAEYDLARCFFDDLLRATGLGKDRLFLVPGNHDVDRSLISTGAQAIGDSLTDRNRANSLLAAPADRKLVFARFKGYAAFVKTYLGKERRFDDSHFFYIQPLELAGRRVALLGLNSAWLCASDNDKAKGLLLGERQARAALEGAEGASLKIALLHHPFDWLREFDQEDSATMLIDKCDFVLHGHMHKVGLLQARGPDSNAMVIAAGSCYETRERPNSYNCVQIDLCTGQGTVTLRTYSDKHGGFWTKDVLNYRNVSDGIFHFALSKPALALARTSPQTDDQIKKHTDPRFDGFRDYCPADGGNPFCDRGRINDPARLFNRQRILRELGQLLAGGNSVSLIGDTEIGKSSVLYYLLRTQAEWSPDTRVLYLDLQQVFDEEDFCAQILEGLGHQPGDLRALRSILRQETRTVLLLDEVEKLTDPGFSTLLQDLLRSLAQEKTLTLAVASHRPLVEVFPPRDRTSPLHNIFTSKRLQSFTPDDARAFLLNRLSGTGIDFSAEEIEELITCTGGHPARLQENAYCLFAEKG